MFCHNCGRELPEGSRFCRYCGAEQAAAPAPMTGSGGQPEGQYAPYTQPYSPAPQPARRKGRAGIFIAIAAALAALLLGVFVVAPRLRGSGGGAGPEAPDSAVLEGPDSTAPEGPDSAAPALELGDDPLTFIFELEGEIYQLPAPVAAFAESGWRLREAASGAGEFPKELQPGETCFASLYQGEARCDITLKNFGGSPAAPKSCHVIQVGATLNSGASITIPEGVTLGMSWQELNAITEPSETTYYLDEQPDYTELWVYRDPEAFLHENFVEILYMKGEDAVTGIWVHTETLRSPSP